MDRVACVSFPKTALFGVPPVQLGTRAPLASCSIPLKLGSPIVKPQKCTIGKTFHLIYSSFNTAYSHERSLKKSGKTGCRLPGGATGDRSEGKFPDWKRKDTKQEGPKEGILHSSLLLGDTDIATRNELVLIWIVLPSLTVSDNSRTVFGLICASIFCFGCILITRELSCWLVHWHCLEA